MNTTGITPLNDIVLVEPEKVEEVTKGGIVLARSHVDAQELGQIHGAVIAMGDHCPKWLTNYVAPGDTVVFGKWAGLKYETNGKVYRQIRSEDIIAKIVADAVPAQQEGRAKQALDEAPPLTLQS